MSAAELFAPPVTVLGVGNILLSDEGFGVHALAALTAAYTLPEEVQALDGGTLGLELLHFVTGTQKLLILDALDADGARGACVRLAGDAARAHFKEKLSAHELGVGDVLALLEATGRPAGEVVVLGAKPVNLSAGLSLSPALAPLATEAAELAAAELRRWGVKLTKRKEARA